MNLDCNLQTVEAKPATAIDVGGSAKKQHVDTRSLTLFLENCQSNSK